MPYNPKSLANLRPGNVPASRSERFRIASLGGRMRAAKHRADVEREILAMHGPIGLQLYLRGRRDGYNLGYVAGQRRVSA
jgi:hypothetical protein